MDKELAVAEYNSLRNEILTRATHRHTFATLNLTGAGVFLTFSQQNVNFTLIFLAYPIFVMFLTAGWVYNLQVNFKISHYISKYIESKFLESIGWETHLGESGVRNRHKFNLMGSLFSGGLFLSIQILCIYVALTKIDPLANNVNVVVTILSSISILLALTIVIINQKLKGRF